MVGKVRHLRCYVSAASVIGRVHTPLAKSLRGTCLAPLKPGGVGRQSHLGTSEPRCVCSCLCSRVAARACQLSKKGSICFFRGENMGSIDQSTNAHVDSIVMRSGPEDDEVSPSADPRLGVGVLAVNHLAGSSGVPVSPILKWTRRKAQKLGRLTKQGR